MTKPKPRNPHPYLYAHPTELHVSSQRQQPAAAASTWPLLKRLTIPFCTVQESKMSTELKQHITGDILNKKLPNLQPNFGTHYQGLFIT